MNNKEKIIFLYYIKKLNTIEISNKLKISKQYVSRIVRKDNRHSKEVLTRKDKNKLKQIERNKRCIMEKRKQDYNNRLNAIVELQHIQAVSELSGRKTINNHTYRNWNSSIYEFYDKTKEYRIKDEFKHNVPYSIPKKIKWK